MIFCFKQKTAYEMRISDWSSDVCSSDLGGYPEKESGLSKIPLIWMIDEAEKAGLRVTESNLAKFAHGAPPDKNEHQGSVANMGHGRAASPSWGIRQHWRNAY